MFVRSTARLMAPTILVFLGLAVSARATAQTPAAPSQSHEGHDMAAGDPEIPATRLGSGTSWLPDESPVYGLHTQARGWMLMGHGTAYLQYLHEFSNRSGEQAGSINWLMGMAQHPLGGGSLTLRAMVSIEPWTIGGCGYPDLLATGESCDGSAIHDRQHPHDLFMELAAHYTRRLGKGMRMELYGGPVGEPALGPVAFMHRISALPNPLAPMTHHWFDATHITSGVVTGGLYGTRWKVEGSAFNGREPDENRTDFDPGRLDSWSGRIWLLPTLHWAVQVSSGLLREAETEHDGDGRIDIARTTASVTYHRATLENTVWASTLGWGRNAERGGAATNALLAETSVTVRERDAWYGRVDWAEKSSHDLSVAGEDILSVAKIQGGYTRYLAARKGLTPGIGATVSAGIVPRSLEPVYGSRFNAGFGVYLTLRPAVD